MNKFLDILRYSALVVLLPLLSALAPAKAQNVVSQNTITKLTVLNVPGNTYQWELYSNGIVDFATTSGNCPVTSARFTGSNAGSSVDVQWLVPGTYFFKVTAHDALNCAMNLKVGMIKVTPENPQLVLLSDATAMGACGKIKLDASKSIGDIIKYEWSLIDQGGALSGLTGINTEFTLSPAYSGPLPADFKVKLQITDSAGKTRSDTISLNVDSRPIADLFSSGKPEKDGSMIVDATISTGSAIKYKWSTVEGKIIGSDILPTAKLSGAGIYTLEITDNHGCKSIKTFKFPLEIDEIIANPDYARIAWTKDTTLNVLANDHSTVDLVPSSVRILEPATNGITKINVDGSITYIPRIRIAGRDQFVYEVCDAVNLCASATVTIDIFDNSITFAEGFSPNGDGINDELVFKGLENYPKSQLYIFTRSGQLIYQSNDYLNNWDGRTMQSTLTKKELVPTGVYYYVLKIGGTTRTIKGFVYIGY